MHIIYKNNICEVFATKQIIDDEISFYIYDTTTNKWKWVCASETRPVLEK